MKKILLVIVLFINIITIQGQVDTSSYSSVYIIRETGFTGSVRQFKVFVDGELKCKLNNDSYTVLKISNGVHTFAVQMDGQELKNNTEKIEIIAETGKTYYLTSIIVAGGLWSKTYFNELPENRALKRLPRLREAKSDK